MTIDPLICDTIMAGSTSKTVHDIFQSMEYGPTSSSSATAQAWLESHARTLGLFINGAFLNPAGRQLTSLTDAKGERVFSVVCAGKEDVSEGLSSSASGLRSWSELSCAQRAKVLLKWAGVLGQHGPCVAELSDLSGASCPPASLVRLAQYYSGWAQLRDARLSHWSPRGVVEVVASDDCPLYSLMLKVLPALAMGNAVMVVPGRVAAPSALLLAQLFTEAGLPAGALNVLPGDPVSLGAIVAQSPTVNSVTYCGNKQDGAALCKATAGLGVAVSVSPAVGATCPFVVFESADIDSAVDGAIEAAFKKRKEVQWVLCVQEGVLDAVLARLRLRLAGLKCVSLASEADRVLVEAAVQGAVQQGATLIQSCGPPASGLQYPATVLCGVAPPSPCVASPPPWPLLPLMTFRSHAEGVTLANHSPHGHAASIWTEDLTLALEAAKSLSVGSVWVNSHSVCDPSLPSSGHKDSGTCTDGGREGLYQFLQPSPCAPSLSRSTPALDYDTFGSAASPAVIPTESAPKFYRQFVAGKSCKSESGGSVAVQTPDGASVLAYCPDGGRKDVRNAVEAAIKVQPGWMKKGPSARAQSLYSLAKELEAKRPELAAAIRAQTGLSLDEADLEVELSVDRLTDWAARCSQTQGGAPAVPQAGSALSLPQALGVVGVVLPDHKPLLSLVTLLGAAVAMGNAVVMVPSQRYPVPALTFIQVLQASDLPAGLVNIIPGARDQLTAALANHNVIKAIWYWGSPEGCQYLQHTCTGPFKTLWLHSGGPAAEEEACWAPTSTSFLEETWNQSTQWRSVWIPTA
ncbi:unnamed protein product [Gadus morhua 'NCC']